MVRGILSKLFGGGGGDVSEVIINDLDDSPNKLFVWQFIDWGVEEIEEFYEEELEDIVTYGMQAEHVFTNTEVEIDEIRIEDGNLIRIRDDVYSYIQEEE